MKEDVPIESSPETFNTRSPHLRAHFENYKEEQLSENGEPKYDEVREEIAKHYGVPFTTEEDEGAAKKENHLFFIDNKIVKRQRSHRAFCVIRRVEGGKTDSWYIDGRLPHATLLARLYNFYEVPDDDANERYLGFLDYDGFSDIPLIQKRAKELGRKITWFLKETNSPTPDKEHLIDLTA